MTLSGNHSGKPIVLVTLDEIWLVANLVAKLNATNCTNLILQMEFEQAALE